ncbi:MAG TPA: DUF1552 domain-containing protein [Polyangiaceae bacterium]
MISRRQMLLGAGSALCLFPWLGRRARAQAAPPRLLLFFTPHGTIWDRFRPSDPDGDFTSSLILEPLAAQRDRLVVLDGLEMDVGTEYYVPHTYTMPLLWTGSPIDTEASVFCRDDHDVCFGWGTGTSIDQFIAERLSPATPFPTLELGYSCNSLHPANRMIYSGPGVTKNPIDDPVRAFEQLFGAELDPDEEARQRQAFRRKSVLDTVLADFNSRRGTLGTADRMRLEAHAESLQELERSLTADALACTRPEAPADVTAETAIDRQADIIASAFGCGHTRIASFQLRIADNDNSLYPWVGLDEGGHHTITHENDDAAFATLAQVYRWYSQRFAYLLDRLANTPDVDGSSVLDNTLVVWGSELGTGWTHSLDNVPFILAGGANSGLRGGQYLDVTGAQTNRVLVTALHAMGLTDVESYGTTDKGSGPLDGVLTTS